VEIEIISFVVNFRSRLQFTILKLFSSKCPDTLD